MNDYKDNNINEMCFDFASIIACDIANEVVELCRNNKDTSKYNGQLSDYLQNNPNRIFFISSPIERYVQLEDKSIEKKQDCNVMLYVDDLPVCLIMTNYNIDDNQRFSYNYYAINDEKFSDVVSSNSFYILNANDYGLYLVGDNDYYTISYPISENKNFMEDVKKLNITTNKISKNVLDLELLNKTEFDIDVKEYDYEINDDTLSIINDYLKDNGYDGYKLLGPIPMYQYYYPSVNSIVVCDYNKENGSYYFRLAKDNMVAGYLSYDSFDEEIQIYDDLNEADKSEKDINAYYVSLADVGYIYCDKVVDENPGEPSCSYMDKLVVKALQQKIKNH